MSFSVFADRSCPEITAWGDARVRSWQNPDFGQFKIAIFVWFFLYRFSVFFGSARQKKKLRAFLGIAQVVEVTRGKISSGSCGYREKWGKKVQQEWKLWIVCVISDLANCRWLSQDFNKEAFSGLFF